MTSRIQSQPLAWNTQYSGQADLKLRGRIAKQFLLKDWIVHCDLLPLIKLEILSYLNPLTACVVGRVESQLATLGR